MISKIGNPDPGTDVHFYRSASPDGTREEGTICTYGGYHRWVTNDETEVTCARCTKLLEENLTSEKRMI